MGVKDTRPATSDDPEKIQLLQNSGSEALGKSSLFESAPSRKDDGGAGDLQPLVLSTPSHS
jgi:hypothetical protein